jgi:hypothetical protein
VPTLQPHVPTLEPRVPTLQPRVPTLQPHVPTLQPHVRPRCSPTCAHAAAPRVQARKAEARRAEERRERERRELEAAKKEANGADKLASSLEELRAKLLAEQRGRREAELALADTRDRIESQRRHAQQAAANMRKQAEQLPALKQAEPRKSTEDESGLKRQLEEALERLH